MTLAWREPLASLAAHCRVCAAVRAWAPWERWVWLALAVLALVLRFYAVGERVMSHDEGLHAYYSWKYAAQGDYQHDPMMHGPLLFHMNALVYRVLGDSDTTARAVPALFGVGVVLAMALFRRWLGPAGALAAGCLALISPSLLFYSRYIRNDIYICLFMQLWVYGMFRYLEAPAPRWLGLITAATALSFACKEVSFMHVTMVVAFLGGLILWQWWRERKPLGDIPALDLAVLVGTCVLPFAVPFGHYVAGWNPLDSKTAAGQLHTYALAGGMAAAAALVAGAWWFMVRTWRTPGSPARPGFGWWAALFAVFWAIEIALYTSLGTNTRQGLATGFAGSLGYWLAQHEEQRGGQPWFYYIMLTLLYEFLPLVAAGAAAVHWGRGLRRRPPAGDAADPCRSPLAGLFLLFCFWWAVANFIAYSVAGEKMPWLLTHIALPLCLLAGSWLGPWLAGLDWAAAWRSRRVLLCAVVPLAFYLLVNWPAGAPLQGRTIPEVHNTMAWARVLAAAGLLVALGAWAWRRAAPRLRGRWVLAGFYLLLAGLTVRASLMATFRNFDLATEPLVYAHGSPEIRAALDIIRTVQKTLPDPRSVAVAYDDECSWPLVWYFRNTPNLFFVAPPPPDLNRAPVILVGPQLAAKVKKIAGAEYRSRTTPFMWWPVQGYQDLSWDRLKTLLKDPVQRADLWSIISRREYPGVDFNEWPMRRDFTILVRLPYALAWPDLVAAPAAEAAVEAWIPARTNIPATLALSGPYAGQPLKQPRDVAVDPQGRIAIADSGNNRIVVLDATGRLVHVVDAAASAADGFKEPWGVAWDASGRLYVADTWNGRIACFDEQGRFLKAWGEFAAADKVLGNPLLLFGPRGLAVTPAGDLLVADTGNKRLLRFTPDGACRDQAGGYGDKPGEMDEPTDVAIDPRDGSILVADMWNRRVQRLDADWKPLAEWPVPVWTATDSRFKPSVAVAADGTVLASDPENSRILAFDPTGKPLFYFDEAGPLYQYFNGPSGLAMDTARNRLLVADAFNNRVLIFPWGSEAAATGPTR